MLLTKRLTCQDSFMIWKALDHGVQVINRWLVILWICESVLQSNHVIPNKPINSPYSRASNLVHPVVGVDWWVSGVPRYWFPPPLGWLGRAYSASSPSLFACGHELSHYFISSAQCALQNNIIFCVCDEIEVRKNCLIPSHWFHLINFMDEA